MMVVMMVALARARRAPRMQASSAQLGPILANWDQEGLRNLRETIIKKGFDRG